jgi:hypothetical protein
MSSAVVALWLALMVSWWRITTQQIRELLIQQGYCRSFPVWTHNFEDTTTKILKNSSVTSLISFMRIWIEWGTNPTSKISRVMVDLIMSSANSVGRSIWRGITLLSLITLRDSTVLKSNVKTATKCRSLLIHFYQLLCTSLRSKVENNWLDTIYQMRVNFTKLIGCLIVGWTVNSF